MADSTRTDSIAASGMDWCEKEEWGSQYSWRFILFSPHNKHIKKNVVQHLWGLLLFYECGTQAHCSTAVSSCCLPQRRGKDSRATLLFPRRNYLQGRKLRISIYEKRGEEFTRGGFDFGKQKLLPIHDARPPPSSGNYHRVNSLNS